jgi:hypothetical protein
MKMTVAVVLTMFYCLTFGGVKEASAQDPIESWTDSTYKKKKYKKVMVIAPFSPPTYRKRFEQALVDGLKERRIKAFPSTDLISDEELLDTTAFIKKVLDNNVDGIVVLNYLAGASKTTERLGFAGPIYVYGMAFINFDLDTRKTSAGLMQIDFYQVPIRGTKYRSGVIINTTNNSEVILEEFKIKATRKLTGDKIL